MYRNVTGNPTPNLQILSQLGSNFHLDLREPIRVEHTNHVDLIERLNFYGKLLQLRRRLTGFLQNALDRRVGHVLLQCLVDGRPEGIVYGRIGSTRLDGQSDLARQLDEQDGLPTIVQCLDVSDVLPLGMSRLVERCDVQISHRSENWLPEDGRAPDNEAQRFEHFPVG